MIFTNCPECSGQLTLKRSHTILGGYSATECDHCDESLVLEITRIGCRIYRADHFENEVLPNLNDIKEFKQTNADVTIYASESEFNQEGIDIQYTRR
jgi:ssDNA-binding Zn-finger/Zn-ribbon topoisomerase 1